MSKSQSGRKVSSETKEKIENFYSKKIWKIMKIC